MVVVVCSYVVMELCVGSLVWCMNRVRFMRARVYLGICMYVCAYYMCTFVHVCVHRWHYIGKGFINARYEKKNSVEYRPFLKLHMVLLYFIS